MDAELGRRSRTGPAIAAVAQFRTAHLPARAGPQPTRERCARAGGRRLRTIVTMHAEAMPSASAAELLSRPARRRAGVVRRALRREASRLSNPHRIAAMAILVVVFGVAAAGLLARGEAGGADARAYWAAVRIWLEGGDPYHPTGPFLPYVY